MCGAWPPTDMTDVQFGHFVVAEVEGPQAMRLQRGDQGRTLLPALHLHADKDHGVFGIGIAVIEFGDVARPQQLTEGFETARPLWDDDGQDGLALFPEFGTFRDMSQALEVHIGPGSNGDERGVMQFLPGRRMPWRQQC